MDPQRDRIGVLSRIGCAIDGPRHYANMQGWGFLRLCASLRGRSVSETQRCADLVGLGDADLGRRVGEYSMGMKQRLSIAQALIGRPELLILDEPTNGLDPKAVVAMRGLIGKLPEAAGCTVFLSSHHVSEVERVATHAALLWGGRAVRSSAIDRGQRGLVMRVSDAALAQSHLASRGIGCEILGEGQVACDAGGDHERAEILRHAVAGPALVFEAGLAAPRLESWFDPQIRSTSTLS
jgi:ABC-2 type transport system ATP-binding protein